MTENFDVVQMRRLIAKHRGIPPDSDKVHIVYIAAYSDYWENRSEFIADFMAVPPDHDLVMHVRFEALSFTASGIVDLVERLIQLQGRDPNTVFVFSPNSIKDDCPWSNIYWHQFRVSDEITRARHYMVPPVPVVQTPRTWAVFVGRRTMPRIKILFDCDQDPDLHDQCMLSLMKNQIPESQVFWEHPNRYYDNIVDWIPSQQVQEFQQWYQQCPIHSIDNYSVQDQYLDQVAGDNRNCLPTLSLLKLQDQYLFEAVFETMTRGMTFTPSEKTVRAIVAHKPTVTYAPPGFLQYMKKLGFETFENLWDESYDQLEGLARYNAIFEIIKSVAALPANQQMSLYQKAQSKCQHNYQQLLRYQNGHSI
jgi:hypothetical protein